MGGTCALRPKEAASTKCPQWVRKQRLLLRGDGRPLDQANPHDVGMGLPLTIGRNSNQHVASSEAVGDEGWINPNSQLQFSLTAQPSNSERPR